MRSFWRGLSFIIVLELAVLAPLFVEAAMSSTNYQIEWDSVGVGGIDTSSSSSYRLRDSFEFIQGISSSSSYRVDAGYRAGVYDPVATFAVFAQDRSTQVAATAITTNTVTVTSTSGYAVGDYVAVVQNEGLDQISAIGRITSVVGSTITVDFFSYAASFPTIDGSNDYVYELTGSNIALTTLSPGTPATGIIGWEVGADVPTGYSAFIYEDHNLRTAGGDAIDDVADGTVSNNTEEYGGRSSDQSLSASTFDTQDSAFTTSFQQVASRSNATTKARDFITLKGSVSSSTLDGSYSHTLTVVFVGNY